jgi:hypothetical protein
MGRPRSSWQPTEHCSARISRGTPRGRAPPIRSQVPNLSVKAADMWDNFDFH